MATVVHRFWTYRTPDRVFEGTLRQCLREVAAAGPLGEGWFRWIEAKREEVENLKSLQLAFESEDGTYAEAYVRRVGGPTIEIRFV
jgi:hypothetical protein